MSTCLNCNKEFQPERATAKYCSDSCKQEKWRKAKDLSVTNPVTLKDELVTVSDNLVTLTPLSVTKTPEISVTDSSKQPKGELYTSQAANAPVSLSEVVTVTEAVKGTIPPPSPSHPVITKLTDEQVESGYELTHCGALTKILACICHPCFQRGITHQTLGLDIDLCKT